ncbi:hypothetical protein GOBAR_AA17672 [Gossypium barbadense]|uniref:Uncharacterized protein n=1 Tax=Gossypium barbadense TaxID=3634 RepID=A0A2P5XI59_GOSBA|nr:hypothetical protein GOBAR_AA17672 [Gossypium barbadense]
MKAHTSVSLTVSTTGVGLTHGHVALVYSSCTENTKKKNELVNNVSARVASREALVYSLSSTYLSCCVVKVVRGIHTPHSCYHSYQNKVSDRNLRPWSLRKLFAEIEDGCRHIAEI